MITTLGLIAALGLGAKPQPIDQLRLYRDLGTLTAPHVSVWLDQTSPFRRGDRARVYVSSDRDAYLTVLRIDTDGRVRVLFPQDPWDDNFATGNRTFEVQDRDAGSAFRVDDPPGAGYVFAIASETRFDYTSILTDRDHWDYRTIADGQVRGDPYVAVTDLAERIVPQGEYDYDLAQYDVEQHYDYPRFVCYDCHAYAPFYTWNPYAHNCVRYRVVIYDDPYYYPYRYYGGRRVVTVRPRRPDPRFVFVDNNGGNDYVTRIPTRPRREDGHGGGGSDQFRPRRGEDVGGRGVIPFPGDTRRRIVGDPQQPGQDQRQPERRDRPGTQPNTPGLEPQPRGPEDRPRRQLDGNGNGGSTPRTEPQRPPDQRAEPQRPPERRAEPQRPPERRAEPQRPPERRAEPQRPPERQPESRREEPKHQDPPPRQAEPRREPSNGGGGGGGGRSSSPELRRRHP